MRDLDGISEATESVSDARSGQVPVAEDHDGDGVNMKDRDSDKVSSSRSKCDWEEEHVMEIVRGML